MSTSTRGQVPLAVQNPAEQVRTLAFRLGEHLAKSGAKVSHSKLLHALSASLGHTDWQVLQSQRGAARGATPSQQDIPGEGFLFEVPVTVDVTATARVKVRARTVEQAIELAREHAAEGKVSFELDDGNHRSVGDHYVGDPDAVEPQDDLGGDVRLVEGVPSAQVGPYLVELFDLDGEEGDLLWADLSVFDPQNPEPDVFTCMSSCPRDVSLAEQQAFCRQIAELFFQSCAQPADKPNRLLEHVFIEAAQGGLSPERVASLKQRLLQGR